MGKTYLKLPVPAGRVLEKLFDSSRPPYSHDDLIGVDVLQSLFTANIRLLKL